MATEKTTRDQMKYGTTVSTRLSAGEVAILDAARRSLSRSQYLRVLVQRLENDHK